MSNGIFVLNTASGQMHYSKTIIIAVGSGILNPTKLRNRRCRTIRSKQFKLHSKVIQRFKDKTVIISGGGNAAIDWANELEPIAKKVYVTYRKDALNGHEAQVTQLLDKLGNMLF